MPSGDGAYTGEKAMGVQQERRATRQRGQPASVPTGGGESRRQRDNLLLCRRWEAGRSSGAGANGGAGATGDGVSGGESFMAALSMALGLADIIQNTAGAVSLETMFVDEGFGSLDDASRDRAIQILELAGEKGSVGIISHVNELKEQIDWKLNITKTEHGSQAKWEI